MSEKKLKAIGEPNEDWNIKAVSESVVTDEEILSEAGLWPFGKKKEKKPDKYQNRDCPHCKEKYNGNYPICDLCMSEQDGEGLFDKEMMGESISVSKKTADGPHKHDSGNEYDQMQPDVEFSDLSEDADAISQKDLPGDSGGGADPAGDGGSEGGENKYILGESIVVHEQDLRDKAIQSLLIENNIPFKVFLENGNYIVKTNKEGSALLENNLVSESATPYFLYKKAYETKKPLTESETKIIKKHGMFNDLYSELISEGFKKKV